MCLLVPRVRAATLRVSMLDARIYRAALVPVLLAVIVCAFSLEDQPSPVGTTLAPDAFSGARATRELDALASAYPRRRAGDAADAALARRLADTFRGMGAAYEVSTPSFSGETIDGKRTLTTVLARQVGEPGPELVVVAHRDAAGTGARAELSGTAAMLELARIVAGGRLRRTVTFVSTSGGSGGGAGARDLAKRLSGNPIDAVLVLGDLGSRDPRRPLTVSWSEGSRFGPLRLKRTVDQAVRNEVATDPGGPGFVTQWTRLAFPGTVSEQGPLIARGLPAVLLSASGERPPAADTPVDENRVEAYGRAAPRSLVALHEGAAPPAGRRGGGPGAGAGAEPRDRDAAQGAPAVGGAAADRHAAARAAARDDRRVCPRAAPSSPGRAVARLDRGRGRAVRARRRARDRPRHHRALDRDAAYPGARRRDTDRQRGPRGAHRYHAAVRGGGRGAAVDPARDRRAEGARGSGRRSGAAALVVRARRAAVGPQPVRGGVHGPRRAPLARARGARAAAAPRGRARPRGGLAGAVRNRRARARRPVRARPARLRVGAHAGRRRRARRADRMAVPEPRCGLRRRRGRARVAHPDAAVGRVGRAEDHGARPSQLRRAGFARRHGVGVAAMRG